MEQNSQRLEVNEKVSSVRWRILQPPTVEEPTTLSTELPTLGAAAVAVAGAP
jgi:hypothetical protein